MTHFNIRNHLNRYPAARREPLRVTDSLGSLLKHKVTWLRADGKSKFTQIMRRTAAAALAALLAISIFGIPLLTQGVRIWRRIGALKKIKHLPGTTDVQVKTSFQALLKFKQHYPKMGSEALAKWISKHKIPLTSLNLKFDEIIEIGKHLSYLELNDPEMTEEELLQILSCCRNVTHLVLANNNITLLDSLPFSLRYLDCQHCDNLTKIRLNHCNELKYLSELPKELKTLKIMDCKGLEYVSTPKGLQKLSIVNAPKLTRQPALPNELKELHLKSCHGLKSLEELPPALKRLHLQECDNIKEIPSFPHELEELRIEHCPDIISLAAFPSGLRSLGINSCPALEKLPELNAGLKYLELDSSPVMPTSIPPSVKSLHCHSLEWDALPTLPNGLEYLVVSHLAKLKQLPILNQGLRHLECHLCPELTTCGSLPKSLETLVFESCDNLDLPESLCGTPNLRKLWCCGSNALKKVPGSLPPTLEEINLSHCPNLQLLPDQLPDALKSVDISDTGVVKITHLPEGLTSLMISRCQDLAVIQSLPQSLEQLDCAECSQLKDLCSLPAGLKLLNLSGCLDLLSIPALPPSLKKLFCNSLQITHLPTLANTSLEVLECNNCLQLLEIPMLPHSLLKLDCSDCAKITHLLHFPEKLKMLNGNNCSSLVKLSNFPASLRQIHLSDCDVLPAFPTDLPAHLEVLDLRRCPSLTANPAIPKKLKTLHLAGSPNVKPYFG